MRHALRSKLTAATALAAAASLAVLALPASSASAGSGITPGRVHPMKVIEKVKSKVALPTENRLPLIGGAPVGLPLMYGGGEVELTNTNYAIFWEPAGHASSASYKSLIQRWFNDVGGSALFNTTTQYYQDLGSGQQNIQNVSRFGGSYVDTAPFPAGGITDAAIQAEVARVVALNGWPKGVGNEYFMYSGPGGEIVSSYCAYHGYFSVGGQTVLYADEPYGGQSGCEVPSSPNGDPAADSAINTTSHEQWETITDPTVGGGWTALDGDEGSDQCNFMFGSTNASGADVTLNGHGYIVQQEWDNNGAPFGCTMG
ncbi:MAG: Phosphate-induced protein 1 conserved region [Frankiales bacterium]|jgi:hypothetical protein|nr:Phosphate-induced protein 1 conserved region [Frankiales bacterium]